MELLLPIDDLNYDWILDMKRTHQDPTWHREGDVYIHTKMVLDEVQKTIGNEEDINCEILKISALLHDVEKRSTTKEELVNGVSRITAKNHARYGEYTARKILYKDFDYSFEKREEVCKLVRYHGEPTWTSKESELCFNTIKNSSYLNNVNLINLATCDVKGRYCDDTEKFLTNIGMYILYAEENGCLSNKYKFHNNASRFKYLSSKGVDSFPTMQVYDDCKFEVIMLSGLAGAGKDYYYNNNLSHLPMISLDEIRKKNNVKRGDSKANGRMIQEALELCRVYLRKNQSFVFNATNLTKNLRSKWVNLFHNYNAETKIIYIEKPYKKWKDQNLSRNDVVPDDALEKMLDILEIPSYDEAHDVSFVF